MTKIWKEVDTTTIRIF